MMFDIVTVDEAKEWLDISGSSMDDFLKTLTGYVTQVVEGLIRTNVITRKEIEYHSLERLQEKTITLEKTPVYYSGSNFHIYNDADRKFGSDTEITDFVLEKETGIIKLNEINAYGFNVFKVDFYGGWSRFKVYYGVNDILKISIDSGGSLSTPIDVRVDYGVYNADDLASAVQKALNEQVANDFTVTYSYVTQKFTIETANLSVAYLFGDSTITELLGFNYQNDSSGVSKKVSDNTVSGIPMDLKLVGQRMVYKWFAESGKGDNIQELKREIINEGGTREYLQQALPVGAIDILNKYKVI